MAQKLIGSHAQISEALCWPHGLNRLQHNMLRWVTENISTNWPVLMAVYLTQHLVHS